MYCPNCDSEVRSVIEVTSEIYPVKGEDITIDARVRFCAHCHTDIWDDELDAQNLLDAYAVYRKKHGLLSPEDIRATREKYNLSQTAFARVLGLGDKTITRYENGSIPDAAPNNLIFLCQQPGIFENLLEKNKERISEADYMNARSALDERKQCIIYSKRSNAYTFESNNVIVYKKNAYWGDCTHAESKCFAVS